jgi:hypothetical protein
MSQTEKSRRKTLRSREAPTGENLKHHRANYAVSVVLMVAILTGNANATGPVQGEGHLVVRTLALTHPPTTLPWRASVDVTPPGFGGSITFTCLQGGPEPSFSSSIRVTPSIGGSVSWLPSATETAPGVFDGEPSVQEGRVILFDANFNFLVGQKWVTADTFGKNDADGTVVHIHALLWFSTSDVWGCHAFLVLTTS